MRERRGGEGCSLRLLSVWEGQCAVSRVWGVVLSLDDMI